MSFTTKSIFINHLVFGQYPTRGYDMLNLTVRQVLPHPSQSKKLLFAYKVLGTEIELKQEFFTLENLENKDYLIQWVDNYRTLITTCAWEPPTALAVLRGIINPTILPLIQTFTTIDTALDGLLRAAYPTRDTFKYEARLSALKQADYALIREYHLAVRENFSKFCICKGVKTSETKDRFEEFFYKGLDSRTKLYMEEHAFTTSNEVITKIELLEEKLLELAIQQKDETPPIKPNTPNERTTYTPSPFIPTDKRKQKHTGKYCYYHRSNLHDSSECQFLMNKQNQKHSPKPEKSLLVREPDIKPFQIELQGKTLNQDSSYILDPGASSNFISLQLLQKFNSNLETLGTNNDQIQFADGSICKTLGQIPLDIQLEECPGETFHETFKVLPGNMDKLILGFPFLFRQKVAIDYDPLKIRVANKYIYLKPELLNSWRSNPDSTLNEKIFIITSKDHEESIISKTVQAFHCYSENSQALGEIPNYRMNITLTDSHPISSKPYKLPYKLKKETEEEIQRLLKLGIIRKSKSLFASPAFPVEKRNGKIRLVVDYRQLNKRTLKESYPFPSVWEGIQSIPKNQIFSQIDLSMGFHQIRLSEESIKLTSFIIPGAQYEYLRVPFGLANSPRFFQRIMNDLLGHLPFVNIFVDDIFIFSPSISEHQSHLLQILEIFKANNIIINLEKSSFFQKEVKYLGHIITQDGIKPDTSRIETFRKNPMPKTGKQLLKLLGYLNWFRPFIRDLSPRIASLTSKTSKNIPFNWTPEDSHLVNTIFNEIIQSTLLTFPDHKLPFTIEVDASDQGLGAVLFQKDKIIGFYSHKFNKSQLNYTVTEKELLAIIESLAHFRRIIYQSKIIIKTDHANLLYTPALESGRAQRWKLLLEEYDYELHYKKGSTNVIADQLSRCFLTQEENSFFGLKYTEIQQEQLVEERQHPKRFDKALRITIGNCNILTDGKSRVIVPNSLTNRLLCKCHKMLAHPGLSSLYSTLKPYLNIQGFKGKYSRILKHCHECQQNKPRGTNYSILNGDLSSATPFAEISSDIIGPFDAFEFQIKSEITKFYLLTITDRCTRWSEVYFLDNLSSQSIIKHLQAWQRRHRVPDSLLSDNGRQYISREFEEFLSNNRTKHLLTTPYNPTSNGISERINSTIIQVLRMSKHETIASIITSINFRLQNLHHRSILASPNELACQQSIFDPLKRILEFPVEASIKNSKNNSEHERSKRNEKRITNYNYNIGTKVYKRNQIHTKLDSLWSGPFTITKIFPNKNTFLLNDGTKTIQANLKQIRPL
jgi:transposase InsO family protein